MGFVIKIFCFLLIFNYIAMEPFVEFTFDAISLGHSGLLITWKPNIATQSGETLIQQEYDFRFQSYIITDKNNENYKSDDNQNHGTEDNNYICNIFTFISNNSDSSAGQYKIHSLKENTLYNVTIKQYTLVKSTIFSPVTSTILLKEYFVEKRTNLKSKGIPAKPYFELEQFVDGSSPNLVILRWYPCGKERICNDQESGTHFGVTIKEPYSTRKWNELKQEEFFQDYVRFTCIPGILYEVVVYSINGDCKTESDSQEIIFEPLFSPVQYVNIISLPDLSALISWKPPKQSLNQSLRGYEFYHFNFSEPHDIDIIYHLHGFSKSTHGISIQTIQIPYKQIRILGLKPEVIYYYSIFPFATSGLGFLKLHSGTFTRSYNCLMYQNEYRIHVYDQDLPIAKPDFNYKFQRIARNPKECKYYFQWLPCGRSFNCKNTRPGSNYTFHFEPEPLDKKDNEKYGYYVGRFNNDVMYKVTVNSSIGNNYSESVTKTFENCTEIRENAPLGEQN